MKTFLLATNELDSRVRRRLETRLRVCDADGGVYGVTCLDLKTLPALANATATSRSLEDRTRRDDPLHAGWHRTDDRGFALQ